MARQSTPTDEALILTLDGYDTETATPEQCAVHSGFDYPKINEENENYTEVPIATPFPEGITNLVSFTFEDNGYQHAHIAYVKIDEFVSGIKADTYAMLPITWLGGFGIKSYTTTAGVFKIDFFNDTGGILDLGSFTFKFKYQIWDNQVDA